MKKTILFKGKPIELLTEIVEQDDDVTKLGHYIVCKETKKKLHTIDWSPYNDMSIEDLDLYIKLGCPKRISYGPLNTEDLEYLRKRNKLLDEIEKKSKEKSIQI